MELAKRLLLLVRDGLLGHDDEVAVAVDVRVSDREGSLEVAADEVFSEDRCDPHHELLQARVQLRKGRWFAHSLSLIPTRPRSVCAGWFVNRP